LRFQNRFQFELRFTTLDNQFEAVARSLVADVVPESSWATDANSVDLEDDVFLFQPSLVSRSTIGHIGELYPTIGNSFAKCDAENRPRCGYAQRLGGGLQGRVDLHRATVASYSQLHLFASQLAPEDVAGLGRPADFLGV